MRDEPSLAALAREIRELNAVLRGQAERDAPVRRSLYESRFMGRERSLSYISVSLTDARSVAGVGSAGPEEFNFPGSVLFADQLTTGDAFIHFDSKDAPGFPFSASTGLILPYRKFFITNTAQAGLVLRLWYGFDAGIIPPNQDVANIGTVASVTSITNPLTPPTIQTDGHFFADAITVTTLTTLLAPASNVNGFRVTKAHTGFGPSGTTGGARLMTKSSAPSAWNDAAAKTLSACLSGSAGTMPPVTTDQNFIVPAGEGIYHQQFAAYVSFYVLEGDLL